MKLISREELKEKLDNHDDLKLVFVLGDWQFQTKHIPGSVNLSEPNETLAALDQDDEIVVYCSNVACRASISAYYFLVNQGFKHVRRFAGGLLEWESAGYPLEGAALS